MSSNPYLRIDTDGHVTTVVIQRPPYNYLNVEVCRQLADTFAQLDAERNCRAIVLASEGKAFCAGADHSGPGVQHGVFFREAMRLFDGRKPMVAAVHASAIGGGFGLALIADFRITCQEAKFSANFNRLGIHPGFGLSYTLPRLIGMQKASLLFYTGRRIGGAEALAINLADELVPAGEVLARAQELAGEIATSAPLAVQATRLTLRQGLAEQVRAINQIEKSEQEKDEQSEDFREGVQAMAQRRLPIFRGR